MQSIVYSYIEDESDWEIIEKCHLTNESLSNDSSYIVKDCDVCKPVLNEFPSEIYDDENYVIVTKDTSEDDETEDILKSLYDELIM
jgi:hypothetical protein